jgi:hypothetical protein
MNHDKILKAVVAISGWSIAVVLGANGPLKEWDLINESAGWIEVGVLALLCSIPWGFLVLSTNGIIPTFLKNSMSGQQSGTSLQRASQDWITKNIKIADEIRIFASGSESYWSDLNKVIKEREKRLHIKVLIRTDNTPERQAKVSERTKKLLEDIQSDNVKIEVEIEEYEFDCLMFRGYIFDKDRAAIDWYDRTSLKTKRSDKLSVVR